MRLMDKHILDLDLYQLNKKIYGIYFNKFKTKLKIKTMEQQSKLTKIFEFFKKYQSLFIILILFILLVSNCNKKSREKDILSQSDSIKIENKKLQNKIDTIQKYFVDTKELELMLEITKFQMSYRVVYDNNTIVRKTTRPDDIMNEYNESINKINKELEEYRKNKIK